VVYGRGKPRLRYILDVPPEMVDQVNKLLQVRSDRYRTPQDFIVAAIQNQLYLEFQEPGWSLESQKMDTGDYARPAISLNNAIQLLQLSPDLSHVKTFPLSDSSRPDLLWGQYNRIFPVKVVTRIAANLGRIKALEYFPLAVLYQESAEIARQLGKTIARAETKMGRKRGEIISAGLPIGRAQDKARSRFQTHFVGHLSRRNIGNEIKFRVEGAAPALKFLEIDRRDDSVVAGVTDYGLKFACLPNPVIDSQDYSTPFSSEEVSFLLDHIASQLPEEAKLVRLILSCIKKGIATPEDLNAQMKSAYPKWRGSEPATMRAGVVSRISELGLLDREKDGVKVTYKLTDLGEEYLARLAD